MPTKKGYSTAKKGKAEEPKKKGKENKKGGKEERSVGKKTDAQPAKGKGKDLHAKKEKKIVSESEEGSEKEEEEELTTTEEEEGEDSEGEVVTKKADKVRAKTALKGASKAMALKGFKPQKLAPPSEDEEDEEQEEEAKTKMQVKKGMGALNLKKMSDIHIKGASKVMMGFGGEGQKKNAATKSQKTADVRSHMKGASKALTGLTGIASPFGFSRKQQQVEKAKPKRNLKSTSRLFLGLSKKKKPPVANKPLLGSDKLIAGFGAKLQAVDKKPGLHGFSLFKKKEETPKENIQPKKIINLNSLGANKKMASEAKELGGRYKGMFGKKKALSKFKNKSWMLGRIATATNWLTGRILDMKGQGRLGSGVEGYQQKRLTSENRDARRRQTHYYNEAYEYDDDDDEEYGLEEDYHGRVRTRCYPRHPITDDFYSPFGEEIDYYEDDDWYGYYDDGGSFYNDEFYYDDDVNDNSYPCCYYDDTYEWYYQDEDPDCYGDNGMLYVDQGPDNGFFDPYGFYGDNFNDNWGYNYRIPDLYSRPSAVPDISGLYHDPVNRYIDPATLCNPYQQPFHMDPGLGTAEMGQIFAEKEQVHFPVAEPFRFPRPQVRLFGKDRLEVANMPSPPPAAAAAPPPPPPPPHPPPPTLCFPSPLSGQVMSNFDMLSDGDIKHQQLFSTYHPPQPHYSTVMTQTPNSSSQIPSPTAMAAQQEYFTLSQSTYPPISYPLNQMSTLPPQPSFISDPTIFQMGQILPRQPQMPPPLPLPRPLQQRRALPLHMRPGSAKAPDLTHFPPPNTDLQTAILHDPHHFQHRGLIQRKSVVNQRPTSTSGNQRPSYSTSSAPHCRRDVPMRQSQSRGHGGTETQNYSPTIIQSQSPLSGSLSSPRELPRKRASPPTSSRVSFGQHPTTDIGPLPSTRLQLSEDKKQSFKVRQSASPPIPSSQRQSPSFPDRSQSPPPNLCSSLPYHHPSTPHTSRQSLRSSQQIRIGVGSRDHIPLGAVKPSPASPYLKRRSRHGPPVTQHVAPFRSSFHSGPARLSGHAGSRVGTPIIARTGSNTASLRESKQIQAPQGGFHRPVGRGQPLVRMPRKQPFCQSRQSFRAPPAMPPLSPQPTLKQCRPSFSQPTIQTMQHPASTPHSLQHSPPLPPHSIIPENHIPNQQLPFPQGPHNLEPSSFQASVSQPCISPSYLPPSHIMTQYNYEISDPGPSPKLTNALPLSQNAVAVQNPHLQNASTTTLSKQEIFSEQVKSDPTPGLSLMNSHLKNIAYSSPLQRNANLYTNVLSPLETANPPAPAVHASQHLPSATQSSQVRNASFSKSQPKLNSPVLSTNQSLPTPQQGTGSDTSLLPPAGELTSKISAFKNRFPSGTLSTMTQHNEKNSVINTTQRSSAASPLPTYMPPSSLSDSGLPLTHLPDGTFARSETTTAVSTSTPMVSSALLNTNICKATYKLPGGSFVTRNEPEPVTPSSPMLSTAILNHNVRNAPYQLPDNSFTKHSESKTHKPRHVVSSVGLSTALTNANLHRDRLQHLERSSLILRNQTQGPRSPLISNAVLNTSPQGASYTLLNTSHLRPPGLADIYQSGAVDLMTNSQAATSPQTLDLSSALSRNAVIHEAKYQLSDGNMMIRPGEDSTQVLYSPNLSSALQNHQLQGTSFHLPSPYAVVSPQIQASGPVQHWSQGPGVEGVQLQQNIDGWGAERALSSGTVPKFNKRAMYRDEELVAPQYMMGQTPMGHEPRQWNLSREGEPHGQWFDKVHFVNAVI